MLIAASGLIGCPIAASDGDIGKIGDFLFDDRTWKIRWMVVDTGHWLAGRRVLIHPSAIAPIELPPKPQAPMMSSGGTLTVSVALTKQQIETSPEAGQDEPVTRRIEQRLYDYYGWDPVWGQSYFGGDAIVARPIQPAMPAELAAGRAEDAESPAGDPHLGSVSDFTGYHVHATDGDLGHVDNVLVDNVNWDIRYLIVATRNWLPGKFVQIAPYAVTDIDWNEGRVNVNVTREQVKSAPEWDAAAMADGLAEQKLHRHFGWPGYGW